MLHCKYCNIVLASVNTFGWYSFRSWAQFKRNIFLCHFDIQLLTYNWNYFFRNLIYDTYSGHLNCPDTRDNLMGNRCFRKAKSGQIFIRFEWKFFRSVRAYLSISPSSPFSPWLNTPSWVSTLSVLQLHTSLDFDIVRVQLQVLEWRLFPELVTFTPFDDTPLLHNQDTRETARGDRWLYVHTVRKGAGTTVP
jgi:hypothetical protein